MNSSCTPELQEALGRLADLQEALGRLADLQAELQTCLGPMRRTLEANQEELHETRLLVRNLSWDIACLHYCVAVCCLILLIAMRYFC